MGCFLSILLSTGCNKTKPLKQVILPDSSIYSSQNFTDLVLDSLEVVAYFKVNPTTDSLKSQVMQFYARRVYQFAWFTQKGVTDATAIFYTQLKNYSQDFADNSLQNVVLDSLIDLAQTNEEDFLKKRNKVDELEILLTTTFFRYAQKVYGGTAKNTFDLEWFIPRKKKNYQILLDSLVSESNTLKSQEPENQYYTRLKIQLKNYRNIQKAGGFPQIITEKKVIVVGESDSCLLYIKQHLFLTQDLKTNDKTIVFDDSLEVAIKRFQHRMGLTEDGKINHATIIELNQPIEFRIRQMMVNMERLRWMPTEIENDYLLVNIPEFRLHIFENRKLFWTTNVVVGKAANKTSIFKGNISQIILNPYWGIPTSIVRKEILPKIRRNPKYLSQNNMEIVNGNYRQRPGKNNALGKMKFLFPNNYHIYLHDTPSKGLFKESKRAFSHGCIRVENPKKVALYLLRHQPDWNEDRIDKILKTNTETQIRVQPTLPVYIAYFTSWVDNQGILNFRNDLYNLDKKLSIDIFDE